MWGFLLTTVLTWLGTVCLSVPVISDPQDDDIAMTQPVAMETTLIKTREDSGANPADAPLMISALSRPLHVGTLYDARKDRLIPGISLWKTKDIESSIKVSSQKYTGFQVAASETLSEKMNLLDVSASVKASFLGGLVEVGGSAKYLNEKTSSTYQCRVTLNYYETTEVKELLLSELAAPNPELLSQTEATHVVTEVLYGADALMEFQQTASDQSNKQEIQGNLDVMIKKIPLIEISGNGKLDMNDEDKEKVKSFSCKFYGDFHMKELPSTFEEAVKVYKELPSLLGENGEIGVPLKVWLYPLSKLSNTESKLKTMISETLVSALEKAIDDFHQAKIRTNDLLERSRKIKTEDISEKLERFQDSLRIFTTEFLREMTKLIPAIRGGETQETTLRELLKSQHASGFSRRDMERWLDGKETEINIVTMYISKLKYDVKSPGCELASFFMNPHVTDAFVFSFTSLKYEEPYLDKISPADLSSAVMDATLGMMAKVRKTFLSSVCSSIAFLKSDFASIMESYLHRMGRVSKNPTIPISKQEPTGDPWYTRGEVKEALNSAVSVFNTIPFNKVISFISDPAYPGASVRWYRNAVLMNPHITDQLNLDLTLDPDTVNICLVLSEGNRKATHVREQQSYPYDPERFDPHPQVMSREPLTGRCYWECEWDHSYTAIGVAYRNMDRRKWINYSDKAWSLECYTSHYVAIHNNRETKIPIPALGSPKRVGVFLDHDRGILSFYRVSSDQYIHLHTFHTKFTNDPLHAVFNLNFDSSVVMVENI